nr:hypothetical protein [Tanacetum cinerariifolium]
MQTQTSNSLHNAIMEAGSKDRPPMLAPGNYIQWKSRIKRYIDTKPNRELIHYCLENPPYELGWKDKFIIDAEGNPTTTTHQVLETYQNVEQEIRNQLNAEAEAPEWHRFVTLVKQSQELKHVSYHKLYDILKQHQHEVNEIRAEKIARVANPLALVAQQQQEKAVVNSPQPIYDQEPSMVDDDDEETSKEKEIDKLMALISLSLSRKSTNLPTTTFAPHQIPVVQIRITLHEFTEILGMKVKEVVLLLGLEIL